MKALIWLACIGGLAYGSYWYVTKPDCGSRGAVACPPAELEEGVGVALNAAEVCPKSGYLCAEVRNRQLFRWPLDKGRLKVNVPLPEFASGEEAEKLRAAAIEGIMVWDGHPFPIVVDIGKPIMPLWDIRVVWTQGLYSEAAGVAHQYAEVRGKRIKFSINGIAVVVPPAFPGMPNLPPGVAEQIQAAMAQAGVNKPQMNIYARVKAVAMHEMGHALGLGHSDQQGDVMFPSFTDATQVRVSARDYRTVDALYSLPNGAMLQ